MSELRAAYLEAVSPEDAATVYAEHMKLLTTAADPKLRVAAIALWYDRHLGKSVETVNLNTDAPVSRPALNLTAEQVQVLSDVMAANSVK